MLHDLHILADQLKKLFIIDQRSNDSDYSCACLDGLLTSK